METHKFHIPLGDWLKWLGEHRDGFLVGGAVLYGLGYLVWSYNAWQNHLGQLPAIEFQYLMSGLIPGTIIVIAWGATRFFANIHDRTIIFFKKYRLLRWVSFIIIGVIQMALSIGLIATDKGWLNWGWSIDELIKYTGPLFAAITYYWLLTLKTTLSRYEDMMWSVYRYGIVAAFCWYSLVIYFDLYPSLPQELGGPQPRCAYVDLVKEEVAPSSLSVLLPSLSVDAATEKEAKVIRSRKLNVYFSSSDYLLVRTADYAENDSNSNLKNEPLYELRNEVIRIVQWCPE